jgi:hypothetical protein
MIPHVRINRFWIAVATLAASSIWSAYRTAFWPSPSDPVAVQLHQMATEGKNFDPADLHALGADGLRRVLAILDDHYARRIVWPTLSYADGFDTYVRGIDDRERLLLLAQHLCTHLKNGFPYFNERSLLRSRNDKALTLSSCVQAFERNDQGEHAGAYAAALAPCLDYADGLVGLHVIRLLDDHDNGLPLIAYHLKIEALDSPFPELVREALGSAVECAATNKRQLLYERLLKIFAGPDEENKFQACFALMHQFQHQDAIDYLLQQTASADRERAIRSTVWIGDTCNWGQPSYPALLMALDPLLDSSDRELRSAAVNALSIYAGTEVTNRLITKLADNDPSIVETARRSLIERAVGRAARLREPGLEETLQALAETYENPQVQRECRAIVKAVRTLME